MATPSQMEVYDLDLSNLEDVSDPEMLVPIFKQVSQADNDFKILPARQWTENFLYYGGLKDFYGRFGATTVVGNSVLNNTRSRLSNRKIHIPKTFKAVQIQAANVTRQKPTIKVWPASDDETSETKAKLSNILLDYYWDEDCEADEYYAAILWALLTPCVARKDYYDYRFNRSRMWPLEHQSQQLVPVIDPQSGLPMLSPMTGEVMMQPQMKTEVVKDARGVPQFVQLPSHQSELISAYRLMFNPSATWMNDLTFIGDKSMKKIMWLKQNYMRDEEGYYPKNAEKLKPSNDGFDSVMSLEAALKQLAFGASRTIRNFNYTGAPMKDGCVTLHFFVQPSPNYPYGREIVIANGMVLYDGKSQVYREQPKPVWHPYSFMCYERVPSRLWGTTYAEKLIDINKSYDQASADIDQLAKTYAKPKMIMPIGAGIDRDTVTGNEECFRYNPFAADGGKPAYLAAPQPNGVLIERLKLKKEEFVEASGVTEIMQGIRPQGVTTWRGLEALREEASNAANNFIRMYEEFIARSQFNKLEILRKCLSKPDKNLVEALKIFKKIKNYVTDIEISDFTGDSLAGYVKVEPDSTIGKSRLAMQSKYESAAQLGVLGDIVRDPELNAEYKRKMDIMGFDPPQNKQVVYAQYENEMMMKSEEMGQPIVPIVAAWHDDAIHIREVENLLLDPTLQDKKMIMKALIEHRAMHMSAQAAKMATALQQAGNQGPPVEGSEDQKEQAPTPSKPDEGVLFGNENGFGSGDHSEIV